MSNYQLGKIYKIEHRFKKDLWYIGSTIMTLQERLHCHKSKSIYRNYTLYKVIRNTGGWENFEISLIKEYPCNDKAELRQEEQRCIDALQPTLNELRAYRTEEYIREYNKKKIKKYYELNKEEIRKKQATIMTCECGRETRTGDVAKHRRTKIHIELMKKPL